MVGAHLGLLEQWRYQSIDLSAVLYTFAHGVDARVVGLHGIVDHDAALAMDVALLCQRDVRPYAHGHDHQVGGDLASVRKHHTLHPVLADDLLSRCTQQKFDTALFQGFLQHLARHGIQLPFHERVHQMHHGHLHALLVQTAGGFQPQEAAADDHHVPILLGRREHVIHVLNIAKRNHARQRATGYWNNKRQGAGGQEQSIIAGGDAVAGADLAVFAVDFGNFFALMQGNAALCIPRIIIQHDVLDTLFASEHRR